jgi:hypothetical protein
MDRRGDNIAGGANNRYAERHITIRPQGQRLLFGAAQDLARRLGALHDDNPAVFELSRMSATTYALVDRNDRLIARIPLEDARKRLRQRRSIAQRVLKRPLAKLPRLAKQGSMGFDVHVLRLLDEESRALAWAIGSAEPFPDPGSRLGQAVITVGLLCLCVVPGLWYVSLRAKQHRDYRKAVEELVALWRSKGRPDPPQSFFLLTGAEGR